MTMITPSYLGETIEYSSLHACRSTLEDPTVESTVDAQRRLYRLKPEPLREMDAWLAQFRRFWSAHVDALERHLDRMNQDRIDQKPPKKRKTKWKTTKPRT